MEGKQPIYIYIYIYRSIKFWLEILLFLHRRVIEVWAKPFKARNTGQRPDIVDGEDESEKLDNWLKIKI
jgi:hypothetical protein